MSDNIDPEVYIKCVKYFQKHPSDFIEKVFNVKLKLYQKIILNLAGKLDRVFFCKK